MHLIRAKDYLQLAPFKLRRVVVFNVHVALLYRSLNVKFC